MESLKDIFRQTIPSEFLSCRITELHSLLGGPTLFNLEGQKPEALVISTLLHGNEHSGFLALQRWLKPYAMGKKKLPRSVWIFLGNLKAAEKNQRVLETQPDYNRIWRKHPSTEGAWASAILSKLKQEPLFAAVDIHNNSGKNPHYACVARWEHAPLHLAALFGRTVVHAEQPTESFTHAFSDFVPSVTLECGISGEESGTDHVAEFLEAAVSLSHFPEQPVSPKDVDSYQTVASIKVRPHLKLSFGELEQTNSDVSFRSDIENFNFSEIPKGFFLGRYRTKEAPCLVANSAGQETGLLIFKDGEILTARNLTPAMLTSNVQAVQQDCLGYLMIHKPVLSQMP